MWGQLTLVPLQPESLPLTFREMFSCQTFEIEIDRSIQIALHLFEAFSMSVAIRYFPNARPVTTFLRPIDPDSERHRKSQLEELHIPLAWGNGERLSNDFRPEGVS
jgi:hypothetical protein